MIQALRLLAMAVALAPLAAPVVAQPAEVASAGTLGEWIARDQAVGRLAPSAERTARIEAQQREVVAALGAARAALEARAAAAPPGQTCLPPPGTAQLTSDAIGMWLYTRPASQYGDSMADVMERFLAHLFPCR
jgi:hypothetical protein